MASTGGRRESGVEKKLLTYSASPSAKAVVIRIPTIAAMVRIKGTKFLFVLCMFTLPFKYAVVKVRAALK